MGGLLSGLSSLGLGNLENASIYDEPKEEKNENKNVNSVPEVQEKDLIYDRSFECPVCSAKITSKVMKTGKSKLVSTDKDLRPVYDGIDAQKYDVIVCPKCGFAALSRYFQPMSSVQAKLIQDNITRNVHMKSYAGEIYTYEEALERYKLALACAVVKQAKASEKAYICLKSAWLLRGWQEELSKGASDKTRQEELKAEEKEYLKNALEGFIAASDVESFPMCGMDESTVDYLIAVLAFWFGKYEISSRLVASILTSPSAGARTKDRTRELKDEILAELKRTKG
ncbi:MAG: DUF2225 domain-containing protein [Lachnospiraceae bacterium]